MSNKEAKKRGCLRAGFVWGARVFVVLLLIAMAAFGVFFRKPLYNRFVRFPREQRAWEAIRANRATPPLKYDWKEYRGVMHSHTELSHDSMVKPEEILDVLKRCDLDFIFTSDHCNDNVGDYSKGWKGLHDGKLFVRGYEMNQGFMPWGMPDETVLPNDGDPNENARKIGEAGGVLFFAHCEEPRLWNLDELTGIEIYNIHVDIKDEELADLMPDILFSVKAYPDQTFRLIFDRPTPFLERLDALNKGRKIVGIGANDAHQNTGIRLQISPEGKLAVKSTSGDDNDESITELDLKWYLRLPVWLFFGSPEPGKDFYRFDADKYDTMARYVNTHILASDLTEKDLIDALKAGRVFVAFDAIADARGFVWMAESPQGKAGIGESIPYSPEAKLRVASPHEARFTVVQDGRQIAQGMGFDYEFVPPGPGKYRVEAELNILGEWTPWVYSNHLELTQP